MSGFTEFLRDPAVAVRIGQRNARSVATTSMGGTSHLHAWIGIERQRFGTGTLDQRRMLLHTKRQKQSEQAGSGML